MVRVTTTTHDCECVLDMYKHCKQLKNNSQHWTATVQVTWPASPHWSRMIEILYVAPSVPGAQTEEEDDEVGLDNRKNGTLGSEGWSGRLRIKDQ